MKACIDISVFVAQPAKSHGVLHGVIDTDAHIAPGAPLTLLHPDHPIPTPLLGGWTGTLTIEAVLAQPAASGCQCSLSLQDAVLPDEGLAQQFVAHLLSAFGLHFDPTELSS